jgi:hypothetical protein
MVMGSRYQERGELLTLPRSHPAQRPAIVPKFHCRTTKGPDMKRMFSEIPYRIWGLPV